MSRIAVVLVTAVVATIAATSADGGADTSRVIRPGVGIGKVRLGMSLTQVRRALGADFTVNRRLRRGFGATYVELGWDYSWWRVGFLVRRGRYRTVLVATQHRSERTRTGLGVGTPRRVLLRRLPVRCSTGPPPRDTVPPITGVDPLTPRGCILGSTRGRFTVFGLGAVCRKSTPVATPLSPTGLPCPLAQQRIVVVEVTVREPF